MQLSYLFGTFMAFAAGTAAMPAPQSDCWSTCSTNCVSTGNLTCTCLTGARARDADPKPQSAEADCWLSCSLDCLSSGSLRGGLCSADGTCTCLEGIKKRDAAPTPQSAGTQRWETCSTNCPSSGSLRGGLCFADGNPFRTGVVDGSHRWREYGGYQDHVDFRDRDFYARNIDKNIELR
ncbi:hypothetical protein L207DRAFT_562617 [Hyaloscypha variabilis F]|uniref:Extracellular membrane protein CFEM domain-containing protein n=1 Tax=Hyaloscypha variabilis (strain UAMH 11265 / GT02V1 / F) TaxID=1149755 RepID=A0A2J6S3T4_HYAVF|nr:hypothetical protein L207DRAFT_562617 [Hyaloscypha variabilis F]